MCRGISQWRRKGALGSCWSSLWVECLGAAEDANSLLESLFRSRLELAGSVLNDVAH